MDIAHHQGNGALLWRRGVFTAFESEYLKIAPARRKFRAGQFSNHVG